MKIKQPTPGTIVFGTIALLCSYFLIRAAVYIIFKI